jgi:hypothetical protein
MDQRLLRWIDHGDSSQPRRTCLHGSVHRDSRDAPGFSVQPFGVAQPTEPSDLFKCYPPGLPELGWATYTPGLFTGVGFTCVPIPHESFGDYLIQNGKVVLKYLSWIRNL